MNIRSNINRNVRNKSRFLLFKRFYTGTNKVYRGSLTSDFGGDFLISKLNVRSSLDSIVYDQSSVSTFNPDCTYTIYVDLSQVNSGDGSEYLPFNFSDWQNYMDTFVISQGETVKVFLKGDTTSYGIAVNFSKWGSSTGVYYLQWVNGIPWTLQTDTEIDCGYGAVYISGGVIFYQDNTGTDIDIIETQNTACFNNMYIRARDYTKVPSYGSISEVFYTRGSLFLASNLFTFGNVNMVDCVVIADSVTGGMNLCTNCAFSFITDLGVFQNLVNSQWNWISPPLASYPDIISDVNEITMDTSVIYAGITPSVYQGYGYPSYQYIEKGLFNRRSGIGTGYYPVTATRRDTSFTIDFYKCSSYYKYMEKIFTEHIVVNNKDECKVIQFISPVDNKDYGIGFYGTKIFSGKGIHVLVESDSVIYIDFTKDNDVPLYIDVLIEGYFVDDDTLKAIEVRGRK